jgi:hypothetical protein
MQGRNTWRTPAAAVGALAAMWVAVLSGAEQDFAAGKAAAEPPTRPPYLEVIKGEKLPPEAIGESYSESMADVAAREQANPSPPRGRDEEHIGRDGLWVVPSRGATFHPHSGEHYATNKWGDTRMGITFPQLVTVKGTYVAGQAAPGAWTTGLRVVGYRGGREVGHTEWFENISDVPAWFEIGLRDVDRIVFEARPVIRGAAWYAIDDFTYTTRDESNRVKTTVIDFEDCHYRQTLTGSGYAGLTWETGTGVPEEATPIHAPEVPPGKEKVPGEERQAPPVAPQEGRGTLPDLYHSFQGVLMGNLGQNYFPPDSHGSVGSDYYTEIVNCNFAVYDKVNGLLQMHHTLSQFMPGADGDPRIIFDPDSQRWIAVATNWYDRIYLNVSYTDDPMGTWFKTSIIISQGDDAGRWPDFPTLGVDANGIYTASYMVGGDTMTVLAIEKAPLVQYPPQMGTVTAFRNLPFEGAIQPALTFGDPGREYFLSINSSTRLRLRFLLPPLTDPTLLTAGFVTVPTFGYPPDAPALGSATDIDTGDDRLQRVVYRDGYLWTAHTIGYDGRCAARWYKIDASTADVESGTVADSSLHYYYPSVMVNAAGDAVMGFSGSDADQWVGCYYTGRRQTDPVGEMAEPVQYKEGTGPWNHVDGYGRNRWGDYSHTVIDPEDGLTFYTIQEHGMVYNRWSTYIAELGFPVIPENDHCADAIAVGDGVTAISNVGASTDGPDEPDMCDFNGYTHVESDVWYLYTATCTGNATVDLCNSDYDNKVAIYAGGCPAGPGEAIACDDSSCGDEGAIVSFPVQQDESYWIRVGGYQGATGTALMMIECEPESDCPADFDGDGDVDTADLLFLLGAWGTPDGDVDGDGDTDTADLLALLADWGPC